MGVFSEAPLSLVGPGLVELAHPEVEVRLELHDRLVEIFAEGDAIELVEHGLVEALDDAVGLRALALGSGVVDVLDHGCGSAVFARRAAVRSGHLHRNLCPRAARRNRRLRAVALQREHRGRDPRSE